MCPAAAPEEYYFNVFGSVNQSAEIVPFPGVVALLQELHKEYYFSVLGSVNQSAEIVPFPGAAGTPARAPWGALFQCFWFSKSVI